MINTQQGNDSIHFQADCCLFGNVEINTRQVMVSIHLGRRNLGKAAPGMCPSKLCGEAGHGREHPKCLASRHATGSCRPPRCSAQSVHQTQASSSAPALTHITQWAGMRKEGAVPSRVQHNLDTVPKRGCQLRHRHITQRASIQSAVAMPAVYGTICIAEPCISVGPSINTSHNEPVCHRQLPSPSCSPQSGH